MNTRFSKSILIVAIVSLLGSGTVLAGNGNGNGDGSGAGGGKFSADGDFNGSPANRMARISERLGLDPEQEKALLDLFYLHEQERVNMRADIMEAYGDTICAQRQAHQQDFLDILTEEQKAEHEAMMADRENRRGNRKGRGEGGFECPVEDS